MTATEQRLAAAPAAISAPFPPSLRDPDRARRFMQVLEAEAARRGLPLAVAGLDVIAGHVIIREA